MLALVLLVACTPLKLFSSLSGTDYRNLKEDLDCIVVWAKNRFDSSRPDILHKQLKKHLPCLTETCQYVATCPGDLEEAFIFVWRSLFYEIINRARAQMNNPSSVASNQELGSPSLSIVRSSLQAIDFYGSFLVSLLENRNLTWTHLSRTDKDDIANSVRSFITNAMISPEAMQLEIKNKKLLLYMCRACIFVGDAVRYVADNVSPDEHHLNSAHYSNWGLDSVAERCTMQNVDRLYRLACRIYPEAGNPHNQLGAVFFSSNERWPAMISFIRASDAIGGAFKAAKGNLRNVGGKFLEDYRKDTSQHSQMSHLDRLTGEGDVAAIKNAMVLRIGAFIRTAMTTTANSPNSDPGIASTLENEISTLLCKDIYHCFTLSEVAQCVYVLQYALFQNAYAVRETRSMKQRVLDLDPTVRKFVLRLSPRVLQIVRVAYAFSVFALKSVHQDITSGRHQTDGQCCRDITMAVTSMATVFRTHLENEILGVDGVVRMMEDLTVDGDLGPTDTPSSPDYGLNQLRRLVDQLDDCMQALLEVCEKGDDTLCSEELSNDFQLSATLTQAMRRARLTFPEVSDDPDSVCPAVCLRDYSTHFQCMPDLVAALRSDPDALRQFTDSDIPTVFSASGHSTLCIHTQPDCVTTNEETSGCPSLLRPYKVRQAPIQSCGVTKSKRGKLKFDIELSVARLPYVMQDVWAGGIGVSLKLENASYRAFEPGEPDPRTSAKRDVDMSEKHDADMSEENDSNSSEEKDPGMAKAA